MCDRRPLDEIVFDEIGLEGLEGLSLDGLWTRLSILLNLDLPFVENFRNNVWQFILKGQNHILFYELPEPRPKLKRFVREQLVDPEFGLPIQPDECPYTTYKLNQIDDNGIKGSCESYSERHSISFEIIKAMSLKQVEELWGDKLVIVGTQNLRENSLVPRNIELPVDITIQQYCILELIGRSRFNGEITVGKHSLLNFFKDSSIAFYIRNKLINLKLIVKQSYNEKLCVGIAKGHLLTLPRFFVEFKTKPVRILEELIDLLKVQPNGMLDYSQYIQHFSAINKTSLKKLSQTVFFKKIIDTQSNIPYRTLYPNAPVSEWKFKKGKEKTKRVLMLRDKNINLEDVLSCDELSDENTDKDFLDQSNTYLDMSITQQICRKIHDSGSRGCSQTFLGQYFGLKRFLIRQIIKNLCRSGYVTFFLEDIGRQRLRKYVTHKNKPNLNNKRDLKPEQHLVEITSGPRLQIENDEEVAGDITKSETVYENEKLSIANIPDKKDLIVKYVNINELEIRIIAPNPPKPKALQKDADENSFTTRQLDRRTLILSLINHEKIMELHILHRAIAQKESELGYEVKICRKSVIRIVWWLVKKKLLRIFDVTLKLKEYGKYVRFVCKENINENHIEMKDEIERIKNSFFNIIVEKKYRAHVEAMKHPKIILENTVLSRHDAYLNKPPNSPKFTRMKIFHEFLYYLIYGNDRNGEAIPVEDAIKQWKKFDSSIDCEELKNELPKIYSAEIDWKMFMNPMFNARPGWIYFEDILIRLPLSILIKLHSVRGGANSLLEEYLQDPIRRHYLLCDLPLELSGFVKDEKVYMQSMYKILENLCIAGLIQFEKYNQNIKNTYVYLNRNALLLDTKTSDKAYYRITNNKTYKELHFKFDTKDDIENYWQDLYKICMITKLGCRSTNEFKRCHIDKNFGNLLIRAEFDQAQKNDIGYLPGDNRGAAGLHSSLFAHVRKNWNWTSTQKSRKLMKPKQIFLFPKINQRSKKNTKFTIMSGKKIPMKRKLLEKKKRAYNVPYDAIDKEALRMMSQIRATWNDKEDQLLLVCRAVTTYLHNGSIKRVISSHTMRDVLHWQIRTSMNKTSKACQRRIQYIMKNEQNINTIRFWINELTQNEFITKMFGVNFLNKLKIVYPSLDDYLSVTKIYFVQLVYYLNKILNNSSTNAQSLYGYKYILPETLNQFQKFYKELETNYKINSIKHFNPMDKSDIDLCTINSLIHSSICCSHDKTLYNIQLFEIYKNYEEDLLARAFRKTREDQLIVVAKRTTESNYRVNAMNGNNFHISNIYRQQFFLSIPYEIIQQCYDIFEESLIVFPKTNGEKTDMMKTYTTVNSGTCFYIAEIITKDYYKFIIETPKEVLKIDPQQESNYRDSEKIIEHFRFLFDMAPKTDYSKYIDDDLTSKGSTSKIKFNITTESYKIPYSPYEILIKLNNIYIHFFCILNRLNQEHLILSTMCDENNLCIFNCLLNNPNYMKAIQNILQKNETLIKTLQDDLKENDEIICDDKLIVNTKNCMKIYEKLLNDNKVRNESENKKDFGKILIKNYDIDIISIAKDILEYNKNDDNESYECEQASNKEEMSDKIKRFQDILVVNTPKLSITYDFEKLTNSHEIVDYKNYQVPKLLVKTVYQKLEVLQKIGEESLWAQIEPSLDELTNNMISQEFSEKEQNFTKYVLKFIEGFSIGVTSKMLLETFENESLLIKSTKFLQKYFYIKRVGIESFMYVHQKHIRPWIIHTYHLKRLEKEAMQSQRKIVPSLINFKRKSNDEFIDSESKRQKLYSELTKKETEGKRISKPVVPYGKSTEVSHSFNSKEKEKIIMRPFPWMRINGSLNRRVLDKWIGTVLMECIAHSGQRFGKFCSRFNQLHPVHIMFLLEILQDLECVKLKVFQSQKSVTIFSKYEDFEIVDATEFSDFSNVFIIPTQDAVIKLGLFIGDKKYKNEFI